MPSFERPKIVKRRRKDEEGNIEEVILVDGKVQEPNREIMEAEKAREVEKEKSKIINLDKKRIERNLTKEIEAHQEKNKDDRSYLEKRTEAKNKIDELFRKVG